MARLQPFGIGAGLGRNVSALTPLATRFAVSRKCNGSLGKTFDAGWQMFSARY